MSASPAFRFRLRLSSREPRKFAFELPEASIQVSPTETLEIAARNAETLDAATNFHIDATGYESPDAARDAAESLRVRLRLLNAILGLGLNIQVGNKISAQVSNELKEKLKAESGSVVVDSVWGAVVFPDDGMHFEYVLSGNIEVRPSNPSYILEGLKTLWSLPIALDDESEVALHILCLATQETSEKAAFLTAYLALEQLVERKPRGDAAQAELRRFRDDLNAMALDESHPITEAEAKSITGVLASLTEESFPSALARLGKSIATPASICGLMPGKFLSACTDARNRIAHKAEPITTPPMADLTKSLREFVLGLIWTRNNLPAFTMNTPPSAVSIPAGGMSIRVM